MGTWYYEVVSIDGDYANLKRTDIASDDLKLVARALLPAEIMEGSKLKYELMQYEIIEQRIKELGKMKIEALNCPNCGAPFQPEQKNCAYCGSYIIVSEENYVDLSNVAIHTEIKQQEKYPGVYVYGRLLGQGEKPLALGAANFSSGLIASIFSTSAKRSASFVSLDSPISSS